MALLEYVDDSGESQRFELADRDLIVGRHPECDVVLRETTVSRRHARVYLERDGYYIEDLSSQHGTLINNERVHLPQRLHNQDQIRIRTSVLTFYERDPSTGFFKEVAQDPPSKIIKSLSMSNRDTTDDANSALKLRALMEIVQQLGESLELRDIFPSILDSIFRVFPQATRGYILLAEGPKRKLVPQAIKHTGSASDDTSPISHTIARRVVDEGEAILSADAAHDERFKASESVHNLAFRSIMCAPLMGPSQKPLGMIQVNTEDPRYQFTEADLHGLVAIANLAGQVVSHARLYETQLQFDRRERDMKTARQVQLHFLPQQRPDIPGYQIHDYYRPADGVGGDYYGYLELPDGRCAIALGDVAGKGVAAALLMARLCSDVRYCLVTHPTPAEAVQSLNEEISGLVVHGRFVTFVLCLMDPQSHELIVVNAGHMPPLLRRAADQSVVSLGDSLGGPPLGVDPSRTYRQLNIQLEPGDAVLLYTDGINEAQDAEKKMYGIEQIHKSLLSQDSAETIVEELLRDVREFTKGTEQNDDICLVCFARDAE